MKHLDQIVAEQACFYLVQNGDRELTFIYVAPDGNGVVTAATVPCTIDEWNENKRAWAALDRS